MEHIYILRLSTGKYYIGKTKNVDKRWEEHIKGNGSGWTKKYKPLSLIKSVVSTSHFDEDRYVKEYMEKYGIENVRGGTYSNMVLDANCIAVLEKEIRHSNNLCVRCGRETHFIKDCYAATDSDGKAIKKEAAKETKKDVKPPKAYKEMAKTKKKDYCGSDSGDDSGDDYYSDCGSDSGDCNSNSSNGNSDSEEDETLQVLMSMTSRMLKDARKGRTVY